MARPAVEDIDLGFNKIIQDLVNAEELEVLVGVQEGSITRGTNKNGRQQQVGLNIAQYAAQNEFGTDRIPQRSFMRTAFDENINLIRSGVSRQMGDVIDGKKTLRKAFNIIGLQMQALVQSKIQSIRTPPNSRFTIARKRSSKPLIDFSAMLQSIRYIVRRRR